jgi:Zn-dependent M28 family amino/carboxypeptidase
MNRKLLSLFIRAATSPFTGMPGKSWDGALPQLTTDQTALTQLLTRHVHELSVVIGERHIGRPDALARTVDFISSDLTQAGYAPKAHGFELMGKTIYNVEATLPGKSKRVLVIGAHYDSIPGCAGADDNASGTASVMALARVLREFVPNDTIRFVLFANEEHPCLPATTMGSYEYARMCKRNGDQVRMMVLEMLGFFKHEEDTQHYPFPLNLVYPSQGNFLGFVGNWKSRALVHDCIRAFRNHAQFPSDGVAAPDLLKDIGRSDHWGFWQFGYPAIMITDTANFRNPHYHTENDTADTLDYESMSRVVSGLASMVKVVAGS